ncbi:MAG TPA: hypothetical protein PKH79_08910 [Prolixibacteraceae bacterium]|nr:hypothetical protein [Prolixibacteraceae bacterium]HPS13480.1 hypothetical protein [Prolixibacteraceae bacterium]
MAYLENICLSLWCDYLIEPFDNANEQTVLSDTLLIDFMRLIVSKLLLSEVIDEEHEIADKIL